MLVGRDAERQHLGALLAAARLGQGGTLVISGEPGIGKTALLDDVRAQATGMQILVATGSETERGLPFAGLAQMLRLTLADLEALPVPQADALGVALALRPGARPARFAVGAGLLTLLTQRAAEHPVCLLVDDAQWLDTPTQDALLFVARRLIADPIALVVAARSEEPCRLADPGLSTLRLEGIDLRATADIVAAQLGRAPGALVDRVHALAMGNPLAVRELVADPLALGADPLQLPHALPESLTRIYVRRADELPPDALLVARCAAVAGEDVAVVGRSCGVLGTSLAALEEVEAAGLVTVEGSTVRFRHPLMRSALVATTPASVRRRLHAATATALAGVDEDRRTWHASQAVLGPDEPIAQALEELGIRAAGRAAPGVAAAAAERAAELSPQAQDRGRRMLAAGMWSWRAGDVERAAVALLAADQASSTREVRGRSVHLLGVISARTGSLVEARDRLLLAADLSGRPMDGLISLAEAVNVCYYLGDPGAAVDCAQRIEDLLAGPSDAVDADARARGFIAAGCARVLAGQDGSTLIREGLRQLEGADSGGEPALATWAVLGPLFLRDSSTGRAVMEKAVAATRARTALGELPHLIFHVARDEAAGDRWDRAEADYGEAISLARELAQTTELAASLAGLAWLQARTGRVDPTREHAAEALDLCARHQVRVLEMWARLALADLALGMGDVQDALDRYRQVHHRLAELGLRDVDLDPVPEIVECLVRLGRSTEADGLAADYAQRAAAKGQPWALARAARVRGLLAGDSELDDAFGAAWSPHADTLDLFELARTQLAYGSRLRRARRRVDARPVLRAALDAFLRIGARPWADAAADELAATGATVTRPGESPRSQLTPRELQIAVALADGHTTRETAGTLFLSPKTVEYHVRNIYLKLGISSRAELAQQLRA